MESSELRNQRLKEVFQRKIQEFRTVCYVLTGYQIDITTENQYRLTSVYAEHMDDSLLFKKVHFTFRPGQCGHNQTEYFNVDVMEYYNFGAFKDEAFTYKKEIKVMRKKCVEL